MKVKELLAYSSEYYTELRTADNKKIGTMLYAEAIEGYGNRSVTRIFHSPFNTWVMVLVLE